MGSVVNRTFCEHVGKCLNILVRLPVPLSYWTFIISRFFSNEVGWNYRTLSTAILTSFIHLAILAHRLRVGTTQLIGLQKERKPNKIKYYRKMRIEPTWWYYIYGPVQCMYMSSTHDYHPQMLLYCSVSFFYLSVRNLLALMTVRTAFSYLLTFLLVFSLFARYFGHYTIYLGPPKRCRSWRSVGDQLFICLVFSICLGSSSSLSRCSWKLV